MEDFVLGLLHLGFLSPRKLHFFLESTLSLFLYVCTFWHFGVIVLFDEFKFEISGQMSLHFWNRMCQACMWHKTDESKETIFSHMSWNWRSQHAQFWWQYSHVNNKICHFWHLVSLQENGNQQNLNQLHWMEGAISLSQMVLEQQPDCRDFFYILAAIDILSWDEYLTQNDAMQHWDKNFQNPSFKEQRLFFTDLAASQANNPKSLYNWTQQFASYSEALISMGHPVFRDPGKSACQWERQEQWLQQGHMNKQCRWRLGAW